MAEPQVQYCTSFDGTSIAYAMHSGPDTAPVLQVPSLSFSHAQMEWSLPNYRAWYEALTAERPVIRYDHRGGGLSDRSPEDTSLEAHVADAIAVLDALGLERVHVFGPGAGSMLAIALASKAPSRVLSLALWMAMLRWQAENTVIAAALLEIAREDLHFFFRINAGALMGWGRSADAQDAIFRFSKASVTREDWLRQRAARETYDVAESARIVRSPTLVAIPAEPQALRGPGLDPAREVVKAIPGARLLPCAGAPAHFFNITDDAERAFIAFMQEHDPEAEPAAITTPPSEEPAAAGMAVVLFTDIVDSTALTERLGDTVFRTASRTLDDGMRVAMREAGGAPVDGKVLGDGVMAVFPTASQAIAAARRCIELSTESELQLHVGLHVGDVIREKDNVYGGAVNIASRICGLSAPGEVLVSATVRELARTSAGVTFADRGKHALKGIDDAVRLFEVRWQQ